MPLSHDASRYCEELFRASSTALETARERRRSVVWQNRIHLEDAEKIAGYPGVLEPDIDHIVAMGNARKNAMRSGYEWDGQDLTEEIVAEILDTVEKFLQQSFAGLMNGEAGRMALLAERTSHVDPTAKGKFEELKRHVSRTVCNAQKAMHNELSLQVFEEKKRRNLEVTPRRTQPQPTQPDLTPEKAYSALSTQLESLQQLKGLQHSEGKSKESEWTQLTGKLIIRAFGSDSPNRSNFSHALSAGEYYIRPFDYGEDEGLNQSNYEARVQAYEGVLNSCLAELKLDLPQPEIQGVFEPGQEYEFYRAVKTVLGLATKEIFVIDPYLSVEIFDVYAGAIPRSVKFSLLTANLPSAVLTLAQKYASGGNFQLKDSKAIHDRVLFADNRVWLCGQSLKDAAKK